MFLRRASVPVLSTSWLYAHARRHHPALTEMYQSKFGSSREAKPRVRISRPSIPHVGTVAIPAHRQTLIRSSEPPP
ncbi:hypothetical protein HOY80DRAFT_968425 [Tuber brumale]|nr:hypothetical protein HOY80DRAFT_968425 [Tuber brumale]